MQKAFYTDLAEELIDNQEDSIGRCPRRSLDEDFLDSESPAFCRLTGRPRSGVGVHLTPTKRRRELSNGRLSSIRAQGRCRADGCNKKCTFVCSLCLDHNDDNFLRNVYLCHSSTNRSCFAEHLAMKHNGYENNSE